MPTCANGSGLCAPLRVSVGGHKLDRPWSAGKGNLPESFASEIVAPVTMAVAVRMKKGQEWLLHCLSPKASSHASLGSDGTSFAVDTGLNFMVPSGVRVISMLFLAACFSAVAS